MIFESDREALLTRLRQHLTAPLAAKIERLVRPVAAMQPTADTSRLSRLGGQPLVGLGFEWPHRPAPPVKRGLFGWGKRTPTADPIPLTFLAQIALAEIPPLVLTDLGLPGAGVLLFFYDALAQEAWGFDPADKPHWRVLLVESPTHEAPWPERLGDQGRLPAVSLSSTLGWMSPHEHFVAPAEKAISPSEMLAYGELAELVEDLPPQTRFGGWPTPIQNDIQAPAQLVSNGIYCGGPDGYRKGAHLIPGAHVWRLLLELGSMDEAEMMWGDCGALYFQMRDEDIRNRRWDQAWMELQCS
ncbi:MAG: DUF1963 domain-containing protein [Proteobacteria bacterium]|nr:DUF1963 domain-containing protein [Pseudomonadota bacterium]